MRSIIGNQLVLLAKSKEYLTPENRDEWMKKTKWRAIIVSEQDDL